MFTYYKDATKKILVLIALVALMLSLAMASPVYAGDDSGGECTIDGSAVCVFEPGNVKKIDPCQSVGVCAKPIPPTL